MKITTIGVDLAKNVLRIHGSDWHGKVVLRKQLRLEQIASLFGTLQPWLVGIEAYGSAHHGAASFST